MERRLWLSMAFSVGACLTVGCTKKETALSRRDAVQASAEKHADLGMNLSEQGNLDGAIAEYRDAIRFSPNDPRFHHNLGVVLRKKGNLDEAITEDREAVRLLPGFVSDPPLTLHPMGAYAHTELGFALDDKGDRDAALKEFYAAIESDPTFGEAYFGAGTVHSELDSWGPAIYYFELATAALPNDPDPHEQLGYALDLSGRATDAIPEFREAIALQSRRAIKPEQATAHFGLSSALFVTGDLVGALAEARKAQRLAPKDPSMSHTVRGIELLMKGRHDEADIEFKKAIPGGRAQTHRDLRVSHSSRTLR